ncbi:hypothetical protein K8W59_07265 [Nocardioides rotundus]|uniref:hypothetical protein n=1 Tax=Nocardioides rotundus TaxID=1774216 RepID=UPI001CC090FC|nr:hypothetical protein [Nocardioides rotundus]UAL31251.1 hypothetical protein K8W59_07265 [Nocardioides rotundus]
MTQTATEKRNNQSRYIPPEQTEALRRTVPDDPVKLPPGSLACEGCGVAVPTARPTTSVTPSTVTSLPAKPVQFARCDSCKAVQQQAEDYVTAHPALAARIGTIAVERVESVLFGLAIIGQEATGDLGFLLPRLHPAAHGVRFANPLSLTRDLCSPYAWSHVTLSQRAELKKAYAAALRDRLSLSAPPVALRCPSGGCLFCGVASVPRAAIQVARGGGAQAATASVWRPVLVSPNGLGAKGPSNIAGHVCPDCNAAIEDAGAVGWPARAQAVVTYVGRENRAKAERLRAMLADDFPPQLPAWGAFNLRPNARPWDHLRRVIDRI